MSIKSTKGRETVWAKKAGAHPVDTCESKLAARNGKVQEVLNLDDLKEK